MPTRLLVICRHAHRDESDHLDALGVGQSHRLGAQLKRMLDRRDIACSCILTSSLDRAKETGNVIKTHLHTPCLVDAHLDEYYPDDSQGFLRILMAVWNALEMSPSNHSVVLVTHSCVLHRCARLFGKIPFSSKFRAAPLASMHLFEFPFGIESFETRARHSQSAIPVSSGDKAVGDYKPGVWYCETESMFRQKEEWISRMVGMVDKMWDDAPVPEVGRVEVFLDSEDWVVESDVWAMKKWNVKSQIMMAISKIKMVDGVVLRCLRDLLPEHLRSLHVLDQMYPDSKWVKYILYPPFVWRLHVHIQGRDAPLPFKNVYLLRDVIHSLEMSKGSQDVLVWRHGSNAG